MTTRNNRMKQTLVKWQNKWVLESELNKELEEKHEKFKKDLLEFLLSNKINSTIAAVSSDADVDDCQDTARACAFKEVIDFINKQ